MPMFTVRRDAMKSSGIEAHQFTSADRTTNLRKWVDDMGGKTSKSDYDEDRDGQQAYFFVEVLGGRYPGDTKWKGVHEGDWVVLAQISGIFDVMQPEEFERTYVDVEALPTVTALESTVVNPWTGERAGDTLGLDDDQRARLNLLLRSAIRDLPAGVVDISLGDKDRLAEHLAKTLSPEPTLRQRLEYAIGGDILAEKALSVVRTAVANVPWRGSASDWRTDVERLLEIRS